jgi:ABC-type microcin C transport system permease subunit YejB
MTAPCLVARVAVRKVQRHPLTQKTLRASVKIQKHVVRGATLGVIPSGLNDLVFHHAQLDMSEAIHIVIDQASVSSMSAILAIILLASRSALPD